MIREKRGNSLVSMNTLQRLEGPQIPYTRYQQNRLNWLYMNMK